MSAADAVRELGELLEEAKAFTPHYFQTCPRNEAGELEAQRRFVDWLTRSGEVLRRIVAGRLPLRAKVDELRARSKEIADRCAYEKERRTRRDTHPNIN